MEDSCGQQEEELCRENDIGLLNRHRKKHGSFLKDRNNLPPPVLCLLYKASSFDNRMES